MSEYQFQAEQTIARPIEEVFDFFSRAENLERITPPLLNFHIITPTPVEMKAGVLIDYRLKVRGLPLRWRTRIEEWNPPHRFVDTQLKGPYKLWHHTHDFQALGPRETRMRDTVRYSLPFGFLGQLAHWLVKRDVKKIFAFRNQEIERVFR